MKWIARAALCVSSMLLMVTALAGSASAAMPGRNGKIAMTYRPGATDDLATIKPDGSAFAVLSAIGFTSNSSPAYSPDGRRLCFTSTISGNPDIWAAKADGTGAMQLTQNAATDRHCTWSADGTRIAFSSNRDGDYDLYTMTSAGKRERQLENLPGTSGNPSWSPLGKKIAYDNTDGGDGEVWVISASGTGAHAVTSDGADDIDPDWSPNGKKIVFISTRSGNGDVYTMKANGDNQTNIIPDGVAESDPEWSPDGKKIAYAISTGEIFVCGSDGSFPTNLTTAQAGFASAPAWQPRKRR